MDRWLKKKKKREKIQVNSLQKVIFNIVFFFFLVVRYNMQTAPHKLGVTLPV